MSAAVVRRALAAAALLALAACTDPEGARETAEAYGFTDVRVKGASWFGCGEKDIYATAIEATNPAGERVAAVVCSGGWAGKFGTLRIERILHRRAAGAPVPMAS